MRETVALGRIRIASAIDIVRFTTTSSAEEAVEVGRASVADRIGEEIELALLALSLRAPRWDRGGSTASSNKFRSRIALARPLRR